MLASFLRTAGITLALVLLGGLLYWQLGEPAAEKPPLSRRQEDVVQARITRQEQAATQQVAQATRTDSAAQTAYLNGQAITRMARQYHQLTKPAHAPLPLAPSAAAVDSLQRLLATY